MSEENLYPTCIEKQTPLYTGITFSFPTTLGIVSADENADHSYYQFYASLTMQLGYELGYLQNDASIGLRIAFGMSVGLSDISEYDSYYYNNTEEITRVGFNLEIGLPIRVNSFSIYGYVKPWNYWPGYNNYLCVIKSDDILSAGFLVGFNIKRKNELLFGMSSVKDMHKSSIFSFEIRYSYMW